MEKSSLVGWVVISSLLFLGFTACSANITTGTPIVPSSTSTQTNVTTGVVSQALTPSMTASRAPIPVAITANPEQLARWQEYQYALAKRFLSYLPPEQVLCEWELLGQSLQEVYVWAVCLGLPPEGRGEEYAPVADMPAVIHLGLDGSVQSVELPNDDRRNYIEGIRTIFPVVVQEKIFGKLINFSALTDHVELRRKNPGPPLIVLLATPQP